MWVTADVDIPLQLLDAAAEDKVVFFVGAGASFNPPSNLPSYARLAENLAREADKPLPCNNEQLDRFIGMLPDNFNAHKRTKDIMSGAHCNLTHKAIVKLSSSLKTSRIITTNYDRLLEEAARELECNLGRNYCGPAVPIGSDFSGLLHLHGSLESPDGEIVLDDRDFARAYLSEGWATRFLLKLFETYTVVFIGYSFSDVIMRYLALGISSHAKPRYIFLTEEPVGEGNDEWRHNGIVPITYPAENNHKALVDALNAWADILSSDYNAYKKRLPNIIGNGVPRDGEELDYVKFALSTPEGTQCFIEIIERQEDEKRKSTVKREWLSWLVNSDQFRDLFTKRDPKCQNEKAIVDWFITGFIQQEKELDFVLRMLCELQSSMSNYLFNQLCSCVSDCIDRESRRDLIPILTILMTSIQGHSAPCDFGGFSISSSLCSSDASSQVLELAIRPYLKLSMPCWRNGDKPTVRIAWPCSLSQARGLDVDAEGFVAFAEFSLRKASALLRAYGGEEEYSYLSRPSIEPSDQNLGIPDLTAFFIETLYYYVRGHKEHEDELIQRWWKSESALLKRLAIHAIAFSKWDADAKIGWVLEKDYLFNLEAHHEIYTLLKNASPDMSEKSKTCILKYLREKYKSLLEKFPDERNACYEQYDVLQWMLRYVEDWTEAKDWCDSLAEKYNFKPRENADFPFYRSDKFEDIEIDDAQFVELLTNNPLEIESRLFVNSNDRELRYEMSSRLFINQIIGIAAKNPQKAIILWEMINRHKENIAGQYRNSIIYGWGRASLGDCQERILNLLNIFSSNDSRTLSPDGVIAVSTFLYLQMSEGKTDFSEKSMQVMDNLALQLWDKYGSSFEKLNNAQWIDDPVLCSLNCWPGMLAYFWIYRIFKRYNRDYIFWTGLNDDEKNVILHFVEDEGSCSEPVWAALLKNISLLHRCDMKFVESWLPDLIEKAGVEFVWNVLLPYPSLNKRLMDTIFLKSCLEEFSHLNKLNDSKRQEFLRMVFQIVSDGTLNDGERTKLLSKVVTTEDGVYAPLFMDQIVNIFESEIDSKDKDMIWDLWLRRFIKDRHDDKGRNWSDEERVAFAKLIPLLGMHVEEGAEYLSDVFPKIILHDFRSCVWVDTFDDVPESCANSLVKFYRLLIEKYENDYPVSNQVERLLEKLISRYGVEIVEPLICTAKEKRILPEEWAPPSREIESHEDDE